MGRVGFIQDKLEIKFLILYVAARLIEPVPFEAMQELTMCDDGIDFVITRVKRIRRHAVYTAHGGICAGALGSRFVGGD